MAPRKSGRPRGRRLFGALGALVLVLVVAAIGGNLYLTNKLDRIEGAFDGLVTRPAEAPGVTVLLIGTVPGTAEPDVPWLAGEQSVESAMLVEIADDRRSVEVAALPLGRRLAEALSDLEPSAGVAAVEAWGGRRVDHVMASDWTMLEELGRSHGSEAVFEPGSSSVQHLAFLEQVVADVLETELRRRPWALWQVLSASASGLAVDDDTSMLDLDLLVLSLRDLRSADIAYGRAQPAR